MKKYFTFMLAAAAAVVACNKENLEKPADNNGNADVKYVDVKLSATIDGENGTKTSVNIGDDNKATVSWNANDQISVFDNASESTNNHNNAFTWKDGDFDGQLPEPGVSSAVYALYPYRPGAEFNVETGAIATKLFPDQNAAENTFANDVAIMAGKITDGTINFRNLCSHIKFKLTEENVKSITLMGNKNEALCGTFEITWNEDEPVIKITKPETYVTVRNSEGTALTAGADYYITTLPVEFTEGFTLILSYMDGSQKVKSLSSDVKLERRKISPLSTPASFDEGRVNYFVQYNDGFDVTVGDVNNGGVTFSQTTNPNGILVNSTKKNTVLKADGVYFISREDNAVQINYNNASNIIICGTDTKIKSEIIFTRQFQLKTNENGLIITKNVNINYGENLLGKDYITQASSEPANNFGIIAFDDCRIQLPRHLINMSNKNVTASIKNIIIKNCDCFPQKTKAASSTNEPIFDCYLVTCGDLTCNIDNLYASNNIFCKTTTEEMRSFKVIHATKTILGEITVTNNTFDNVSIHNSGCIRIGAAENCIVKNNIFVNGISTDSKARSKIGSAATPTSGEVTNNYFYTTGDQLLINDLKPNTDKVGSPVKIDSNPLSDSWAPQNGVYGKYKEVDYYKSGTSTIVGKEDMSKYGAKRADMTATPSTSATANSADYRNAQVDLGAF